MKKILKVSDYTLEPLGRYEYDGHGNGEHYRENYIRPELEKGNDLLIDLDGVNEEYGSSFLVEAFANIIRLGICNYDEFKRRIEFKSKHVDWLEELDSYIEEARLDTQGSSVKTSL